MSNKKIIICLILMVILAVSIFFIFFHKNTAKVLKTGNNMSSQEVVDYFLNISSYEATVTVEVNSNKNSNKYILNQQYISPSTAIQEIIEPSNITGIKIIKNENGITIENTNLSLTTIFENYSYMVDNCLDLNSFIENYKSSNKSSYEEIDGQIVMKTESSNENRYTKYETLYVDKSVCKPIRLEIKDNNQKCTVNILYNEVEINNK